MSELNKVLLAFSDDIVKSAKRHLGGRKIGKNKNYGVASGQLKRSLSYKIRVRGNDIREVTFGAKGKADKYAGFHSLRSKRNAEESEVTVLVSL